MEDLEPPEMAVWVRTRWGERAVVGRTMSAVQEVEVEQLVLIEREVRVRQK